MPHYVFWPFDIGTPPVDKQRVRARTHIADIVRVGVLAQEEGAELRLEGHIMSCEVCREISISLWERVREAQGARPSAGSESCLNTRNALFRHLEEGRLLQEESITHLRSCPECADRFLEPAKALHTLDVDEGAAAAQD